MLFCSQSYPFFQFPATPAVPRPRAALFTLHKRPPPPPSLRGDPLPLIARRHITPHCEAIHSLHFKPPLAPPSVPAAMVDFPPSPPSPKNLFCHIFSLLSQLANTYTKIISFYHITLSLYHCTPFRHIPLLPPPLPHTSQMDICTLVPTP